MDEITWACCPCRGLSWVQGLGSGSRVRRRPQAAGSWASGRKPGLDLQWEVIESVFIHDQSLIQKILGHLGEEKMFHNGKLTVFNITVTLRVQKRCICILNRTEDCPVYINGEKKSDLAISFISKRIPVTFKHDPPPDRTLTQVEVPWPDAQFCTAFAGTVGSLWWCAISVGKEEATVTFEAQGGRINHSARSYYHPHFGEVNQALLREIGRSLLDEGQVCEIHSQIRHTGRVAAVRGRCKV